MTPDKISQNPSRRKLERTTPPGDNHVLVELPSGEERLEPLLDLSPNGIAILLRANRVALQPGVVLPRLRFFSHGECTMQCRATIRDIAPVTLDNGGGGLKLGLQLESQAAAIEIQSPVTEYAQIPLITDAVFNLITARAVATIEAGATTPFEAPRVVRFSRAGSDRSVVVLKLESGSAPQLRRGRTYEIVAELFGTRMALRANYRERRALELRFEWPKLLRVWQHRASGRLRELPNGVEVEFETPYVSGPQRRPVLDVSPRGLSFESRAEDGLLVGMLLRSLSLHLPNGTLRSQGVVRNVRRRDEKTMVAGVELAELSDNNRRLISEFVDAHFHPEVRPARPSDLRQLWPIYESIGLFGRGRAAVSQVSGRIETTRQTLLARGRNVAISLVSGSHQEVHGTAELLRTYGSTWSLQHVGVRDTARIGASDLVVPLIQAAARRTDFSHLHAILDPNRSEDGFARLRSLDTASESLQWSERMLVRVGASYTVPSSLPEEVQAAKSADLDWVVRQLSEHLTPLEISAFCIRPSDLRLADTGKMFHSIGLKRQRLVRIAMSVSGPLGFSLIDQSTPGLSFEGYSAMVRLHIAVRTAATRQSALTALTHDAIRVLRDAGNQDVYLLLTDEQLDDLEALGFDDVARRIEVVATRDGASLAVGGLNLLT
ncbi:MAG: hypothetical protein V3T05_01230 [Myxococcota bacterium]